MRILFVNSARGLGGGVTSAFDLASGLADADHQVTVVCHPESDTRERIREDARIDTAPIAIRAELNVWRIAQLRGVIRRFNPHVILADKRKDVKLSVVARWGGATPAVVHRHGAPSPLRDGAVYRFLWPRLQAMIVNSTAMKRELLRRTPWIGALPIHVIHNGKDLTRYRPRPELRAAMRASLGIEGDAYVACFHGALIQRKRVDHLLRAAAELGGRLAVHVLLVGEGPDGARLRHAAADLGIRITFSGTRNDIPEVLSAADVSVHLSEAEGFSNSVVEALACGIPVIASRAHSHPEQVDDGVTGRLVPPADSAALCSALVEFADPAVRRDRSAAARRSAETAFGVERMVSAYSDVLRAAAGNVGN